MHSVLRIGALALCLGLSVTLEPLHAQVVAAPKVTAHEFPVPSATAAVKRGAFALDGRVDDDAWRNATPVTELKQFDPDHAEPSSERIDVRFLFDEAALYVGARMYDKGGANGIISSVVRRDAFFNSDFFEVVIDGFHDHLGMAFFQVNPTGSRTDMQGNSNACCDDGWDPVWMAKTAIDNEGWSVEMRIPFSQLRFSRDSLQTFGLQIRRFIKRRNETAQWAMWTRNEQGGPARYGHLEGLRIAAAPKNLEILPYAATQAARVQADPADPFRAGTQSKIRFGADVKYLLTPNLTIDATINPDFGQVEVDPAVVNLTAFENFFSERRPFFISGSGVFNYGGFNCRFCSNVASMQAFYSRRVGRAPTGADLATSQGAFADVPPSSPILGAAKLTGRTANGYTVGVLNAVTGTAFADVQRADGSRTSRKVEPLSNFLVARLKKDYKRGDLVLGVIGTSLTRKLDTQFTPRLSQHAELLGADWNYQWGNRSYSFVGNVAASSVAGDPRVITARQRSSARFFQRPGRTIGATGFFATRLDSTATVLRGYGGHARLAKDAGNWQWETAMSVRNPGYETNDYSFLTKADYVWNNANLIRLYNTPTRWYRSLIFLGGGQVQRNFSGDVTNNSMVQLFAETTTPQFWNVNAFVIHAPRGLIDDGLLRGGAAVRVEGSDVFQANVSTDSRKQWRVRTNPQLYRTTSGGGGHTFDVQLSVQPSTRTSLSLGPSYTSNVSRFQYVRAVADPSATAFNGTRYIIADVAQRQLALDTRFNLTFTPTMTLELFAQPFLASGHFSHFKEFVAPRRSAFVELGVDRGTVVPSTNADGGVRGYTIDPDASGPAAPFMIGNPDFNFRSLRGNAVFRWEYHPGSTLFFAWTQQRADQAPNGDFNFARDRNALFSIKPDNVFLVKVSWWVAR